jgi:hypothetical protein
MAVFLADRPLVRIEAVRWLAENGKICVGHQGGVGDHGGVRRIERGRRVGVAGRQDDHLHRRHLPGHRAEKA